MTILWVVTLNNRISRQSYFNHHLRGLQQGVTTISLTHLAEKGKCNKTPEFTDVDAAFISVQGHAQTAFLPTSHLQILLRTVTPEEPGDEHIKEYLQLRT